VADLVGQAAACADVPGLDEMEEAMSWRSSDYRAYVRRHLCPICGDSRTVAAHVGGLASRGTGTKAPDWTCAPLCDACHSRLDGRALPDLTQAEREDVVRAAIRCLGSHLESLVPSDEPDPTKPERKIPHKKKQKPKADPLTCPECRAFPPGLHRLGCSKEG